MRQSTLTGEVAPQGPRGREIPKVAAILWIVPLIDFALDRSKRMTRGRDCAHCFAMVTQNVLECIQRMAARIQAVDKRKNELHSWSTDLERLHYLFQSSKRDFIHDHVLLAFEKFFALYFLSFNSQWEDLSNVCVYHCACAGSCRDIALWVRRPTLSHIEAEKLLGKTRQKLSLSLTPLGTVRAATVDWVLK